MPWAKTDIVRVMTGVGPRWQAPDGSYLSDAEYDALPDTHPEPEPEPGDGEHPGGETPPGDTLDVGKLKAFMPNEPLTDDTAALALESARALIEGYTRGRHLDPFGNPRPGIDSVVLTVAARIAANPGQIVSRDTAGPFTRSRGEGFNGFTLAELAILNRYRKRATG